MYSTVLLVALTTVGGHKCHSCAVACNGCVSACKGHVVHSCATACHGCHGCSKKCHGGGFLSRLFGRKCHKCDGCNACSGCHKRHGCHRCHSACHGCAASACHGCAGEVKEEKKSDAKPELKKAPAPGGEKKASIEEPATEAVSAHESVTTYISEPVVVYYQD